MNAATNPTTVHEVRWAIRQPGFTGRERCQLHRDGAGWQLNGTVIARLDGRQLDCSYQINTAPSWAVQSAAVTLEWGASRQRLRLGRDDRGRWTVASRDAPELDGCVDIDLGVTPSTNTLPIRRLGLAEGQCADIDTAWVEFPSLTVRRSHQRYTRLSQQTWRYQAGTHTSELTVDGHGLVTNYGAGLWHRPSP